MRAEHERWDGAGYPDGLAGEDDPALEPHLPRLRRLARDDVRPPVPARARGEAARAELEHHAARSSAPIAVAALLRVLDRRGVPLPAPAAAEVRLPHVRPDRPLEAELRALIEVVARRRRAYRLEHVLEVVAEQARAVAVRRRRVSISRWERVAGGAHARQRRRARPGRGAHPADET